MLLLFLFRVLAHAAQQKMTTFLFLALLFNLLPTSAINPGFETWSKTQGAAERRCHFVTGLRQQSEVVRGTRRARGCAMRLSTMHLGRCRRRLSYRAGVSFSSTEERSYRTQIWNANQAKVTAHNAQPGITWTMAMNSVRATLVAPPASVTGAGLPLETFSRLRPSAEPSPR